MLDNPKIMQGGSAEEIARLKQFWTPRKIAAEGTAEIEARLLQYGVPYTRDALRQLISGQESAWKAAAPWIDSLKTPDRLALDFVGLAVGELWKRLYPNPPSLEMLDDWMQEGYQFSEQRKPEEACAVWRQFWDAIRVRFTPDMRTAHEAGERVFSSMTQYLSNWVNDFQMECHNGSLQSQKCLEIGVQFFRQFLDCFPEDPNALSFRAELATLYYNAGRVEESEKLFTLLMEEHPDRAVGYVQFSDALSWRGPQGTRPTDLPRAIRLLETALARPVKDAKDYDLQSRLDDLRAHLGRKTEV